MKPWRCCGNAAHVVATRLVAYSIEGGEWGHFFMKRWMFPGWQITIRCCLYAATISLDAGCEVATIGANDFGGIPDPVAMMPM